MLDFTKLVLFQTMLPSLLGSLDCGFRYALMIGFDAGDLLFDDHTGMKEKEVRRWIDEHVVEVAKQNGIQLTPHLVKVVIFEIFRFYGAAPTRENLILSTRLERSRINALLFITACSPSKHVHGT